MWGVPGAKLHHLPDGIAQEANGWIPHSGPPKGRLLISLLLLNLTIPLVQTAPMNQNMAPRTIPKEGPHNEPMKEAPGKGLLGTIDQS